MREESKPKGRVGGKFDHSAVPRALRTAGLILASAVGRFGGTKDMAPEKFMDPLEIEGSRVGGLAKKKPQPHKYRKPRFFGLTRDKFKVVTQTGRMKLLAAMQKADARPGTKTPGSMRGSEWLKENRRRRSAGLPQLRQG